MTKKIAAINYGSSFHLLDHIAPLSYILDVPLFVDDENCFQKLKIFYPEVQSHLKEDLSFGFLAKNFDALFSCNPWFSEDKFSFNTLHNKNMQLIFCPHGNSDKGHIDKVNMFCYTMQDAVLLYGSHMIDLLKTLNVYKHLKKSKVIGNFRLQYYQKFKKFYDDLLNALVFSKLNSDNKTILYAPTWKDNENSTSFFKIFENLIKTVPSNYNLIIKLHPNLEKKHPTEFYQIYETNLPSNILLIEDLPLIYPLLNKCDIYLGDFSSIGYDFLYFQKPMFFLDPFDRDQKKDPSLSLFKCGSKIDKKYWNNIFFFIESNLNFNSLKSIQKKTYEYAFGKERSINQIKDIALQTC